MRVQRGLIGISLQYYAVGGEDRYHTAVNNRKLSQLLILCIWISITSHLITCDAEIKGAVKGLFSEAYDPRLYVRQTVAYPEKIIGGELVS